jgi:hypothetical protein
MDNIKLTRDETLYLEDKLEEFLNTTIFSNPIVEKEEETIKYIIESLKNRISYYPDNI